MVLYSFRDKLLFEAPPLLGIVMHIHQLYL